MSTDPVIAAITALPPLRDVIAEHGLAASKALGQNFLLDLNLTRKIASYGVVSEDIHVLEVGPGPGGLTRALVAAGAAQVIALEKDSRCIAALAATIAAAGGRLTVLEQDALEADPIALLPSPRAVVANLPYNIATVLLIGWLQRIDDFASLTLMFQREVADRITAAPGSSNYGRLSVLCGWLTQARRVLDLPPGAFTPPPKVSSAVVHLTPRADRDRTVPLAAVEAVTRAAFGQRRKTLRQSLKGLPVPADTLLTGADIDGGRRAETLNIEEFLALARHLPVPK